MTFDGAAPADPLAVRVVDLKTENLDRPLGLDNLVPHLSWRLESSRRNVRQSAYRVLVGRTEEAVAAGRGDLWDTGKVASDQSLDIAYTGTPLRSRQRCWWTVQVWDEAGQPAATPPPQWWEMGLLEISDWTATWLAVERPEDRTDREVGLHWIWGAEKDDAGPRAFRLAFSLQSPARETALVIGGRDMLLDVYLDGVSNAAGKLPKKGFGLQALAHLDLGGLTAGPHVLAAKVAAGGSKSRPRTDGGAFTALLRMRLEDGRVERIVSGPEWKTSLDPATDFAAPVFDDRSWPAAVPAPVDPGQPWPATPAMYLRSTFALDRPVVVARLYATALGAYEVFLNARRIGDVVLAPECQDFRKRVRYRVYDVTDLLIRGTNALGAHVGDGWYGSALAPGDRYGFGSAPRRFLAQLELTFADGSRAVVGTGRGWRTIASPVTTAEIYHGETYDARLEQPGWSAAGFDDSSWDQAVETDAPSATLTPDAGPPIRVTETLTPKRVSQVRPGVFVFDFGQNFAGVCRLRVRGQAGTVVRLRFAEIVTASGDVDRSNLRAARAADSYTLRGDPAGEAFQPHFTYHGFRYVEVTGFPGEATADSLDGLVMHSDLPITGRLRIDEPLIEQLWRNTVWSQRSNFVGIPTDCPQRDERLGWTGDANAFWDAASFNMDVYAFTERFLADLRDAQSPSGAFPEYAPASTSIAKRPSPGWADGGVVLPWTAWRRFGSTSIIDRHWEAMERYLAYIAAGNPDSIWVKDRGFEFGDWLALDAVKPGDPTTPKDLIGTAWWARSTEMVIDMARATGRTAEAERYAQDHARIVAAFQAAYVKPDGEVGNGSQTSYILALKFGLVQTALRAAAGARLAADIERRGGLLSTGFLGTPHSLDVLADIGRTDLAYSLLLRTEYPSWGHMIAKGATTIWERWNSDVGDVAMNSYNHYAFGAVCGFLFRRIAGIDLLAPGFKEIVVRPVLDRRIKRGGADYRSVMGLIATEWTQDGDGGFHLNIQVPANAVARIHLPARPGMHISEGGDSLDGLGHILSVERGSDDVVVRVGSGRYQFAVESAARR
jgi:alpha-L-rhamnosidase